MITPTAITLKNRTLYWRLIDPLVRRAATPRPAAMSTNAPKNATQNTLRESLPVQVRSAGAAAEPLHAGSRRATPRSGSSGRTSDSPNAGPQMGRSCWTAVRPAFTGLISSSITFTWAGWSR